VKSFAEKLACIARTILEWYFLHPASRVGAALDVGAVRVSFLAQEGTELLPSKEIEVSSVSCDALIHKTTCFRRSSRLSGRAEIRNGASCLSLHTHWTVASGTGNAPLSEQ
jgi:hypothetical protein